MTIITRAARTAFAALAFLSSASLGACAGGGLGSVGDILGGVLGGGAAQQVSGTVRGVDTRAQQLSLQQSNGQSVALGFDNNTAVIYENRRYAVTALENGDQVSARVLNSNGSYYTDTVWVRQSVSGPTSGSGTTGSGSGNVQSLNGLVRQVDRANGWFTLDTGGGVLLTVSMPYRPSNTDASRFDNLRSGDSVRLYGVFLNNSRVELRQFY